MCFAWLWGAVYPKGGESIWKAQDQCEGKAILDVFFRALFLHASFQGRALESGQGGKRKIYKRHCTETSGGPVSTELLVYGNQVTGRTSEKLFNAMCIDTLRTALMALVPFLQTVTKSSRRGQKELMPGSSKCVWEHPVRSSLVMILTSIQNLGELARISGWNIEQIIIGHVLKAEKYWNSSSPSVWKTPAACRKRCESKTSKYDYIFLQ